MNLKTAKMLRKITKYHPKMIVEYGLLEHKKAVQVLINPECPRGKYRMLKKAWKKI